MKIAKEVRRRLRPFWEKNQYVGSRSTARGVGSYFASRCSNFASFRHRRFLCRSSYTDCVDYMGSDSGDCIGEPCRTIQFAIDTAADGDTIRVRKGIYSEILNINARNSLLIQGTDVSETIVEGQHVFSQIRIESSSNIEISNLTIRGGGNRRSNEGGAVQNRRSIVTLRNLILTENSAVNGGALAVELGGILNIENCLIVENEAANAAGVIIVRSDPTEGDSFANVQSSTIVNNVATFLTGGIVNEGKLIVSNSILWNNALSPINTVEAAMTSVRFSDIDGGHVGVGNIDEDPRFVDEQTDNYRLSSASPAIDAGTNAGAPDVDLDGRRRPRDGDADRMRIVDMGAFEFGPVKERDLPR
jgi:hypothetical protein